MTFIYKLKDGYLSITSGAIDRLPVKCYHNFNIIYIPIGFYRDSKENGFVQKDIMHELNKYKEG